jgi:hypothetical protein
MSGELAAGVEKGWFLEINKQWCGPPRRAAVFCFLRLEAVVHAPCHKPARQMTQDNHSCPAAPAGQATNKCPYIHICKPSHHSLSPPLSHACKLYQALLTFNF